MASCTLLRKLPRELRDQTYEEALIVEEVTIDANQDRGANIIGLLLTCKQIRAEASKTFYSKNHFRVITPQNAIFTPVKWLSSILTGHRKQFRKITVHFTMSQYHPGWSYAHIQDLHKQTLHNMMVTESRYLSDKRRVETYELLERLATVPRLPRKIIGFEITDAAHMHSALHDWVHEFRERLKETMKHFADDRGLMEGCPACRAFHEGATYKFLTCLTSRA